MTHDPDKGRLTIEATPEKHRHHGAYRLIHTHSNEWALIEYSDDRAYLEVLLDYLERIRGMRREVREAEAQVLLKVLGVDLEELR